MSLPAIGSQVRVLEQTSAPRSAFTGTVACLSADGERADLVECTPDGRDVDGVPLAALQPLEPWETEATLSAPAAWEEWKARGDTLYRLGDVWAAVRLYETGCDALNAQLGVSVGCDVLVRSVANKARQAMQRFRLRPALVECVERRADGRLAVDVAFEDVDGDEAVDVDAALCVVVHQHKWAEQTGLLLNLARALTRCGAAERVLSVCDHALAIARMRQHDGHQVTAYTLRAKAYASLGMYNQAEQNALAAVQLSERTPDGPAAARKLVVTVRAQRRQNRKLTRDVMAWVDTVDLDGIQEATMSQMEQQ